MPFLYLLPFTSFFRSRKDLDRAQMKFHNSEKSAVIETVAKMTNPFDPDLKNLVNIASGEVARPGVVKDMLVAKQIGEEKFHDSVQNKVKAEKPDIFSTILKANIQTFARKQVRSEVATKNGKIVELPNDVKFISHLLTIGESREIDMRNLMSYSLRKFPSPFATID